MNRAFLFVLAPVVLGVAGLACNGKVAPDDSGSLSSKAKTDDAEKPATDDAKKSSSNPPSSVAPGQDATPRPPSCEYGYQSSSSSGDPPLVYSCESTDNYTCAGAPQDITCSCSGSHGTWSKGSCSCNGLTFDFDCNTGCLPGPAEYAKCNLPVPDDYGTSGSTTSSSSSSSGSSGSSSSSSG